MATMFYDRDADLELIRQRKVAVIGYGSQGHAHALNLRDSGVEVKVALRPGSRSRAAAERDGFAPVEPAAATQWAEVIMILAPDLEQPALFTDHIAPNLRDGQLLLFAHGFAIRFGWIVPPPGIDVAAPYFVPASALNALRREATAALIAARVEQRPVLKRAAPVEPPVPYLDKQLDFLSNVFNTPARNFYKKHCVELIADAYEEGTTPGEVSLMITKHCLRYSFNLCPKEAKDWKLKGVKAEPMTLINGNEKLKLRFDCKACEMHVVGKMKPGMSLKIHAG